MSELTIQAFRATVDDFAWWQLSAVMAGEVVGTATIYYLDQTACYPELCNVYVREGYRCHGIGTALLQRARQLVAGNHSQQTMPGLLSLEAVPDSAAEKFWLSQGFEAIRILENGRRWLLS